jgi:hypothetical protein
MKKYNHQGIKRKFILNKRNINIIWLHKIMKEDHLSPTNVLHPIKKEEYDKLRDTSEYSNEIILNLWWN